MIEKNWAKTKEVFTVCFGPASQSIGRGRISREGPLDVRKSRERCDKIVAKKIENAKILELKRSFHGEFSFFGRGKTNFWGGGYNFKTC